MNGPTSSDTAAPSAPLALRLPVILYGVVCYLVFLAAFLYAIGFVGNLFVPKSIDSGNQVPLVESLPVNLLLLGLFLGRKPTCRSKHEHEENSG